MLLYKSEIVFPSIIYSKYAFYNQSSGRSKMAQSGEAQCKYLRNSLNIGVKSRVRDYRTDN